MGVFLVTRRSYDELSLWLYEKMSVALPYKFKKVDDFFKTTVLQDVQSFYQANIDSVNTRYKKNIVEEYIFDFSRKGIRQISAIECICILKLIEYQCTDSKNWYESDTRKLMYKYLCFTITHLLGWSLVKPIDEKDIKLRSLAKFVEENITGVDECDFFECDRATSSVELEAIEFIKFLDEYMDLLEDSVERQILLDWGMEAMSLLPGYSQVYASLVM